MEDGTDSSAINLKECENILKDVYNISNSSLIILKFMKENTGRQTKMLNICVK